MITSYVRQNEREDIYQCPECEEYISVPRGVDSPECFCTGE